MPQSDKPFVYYKFPWGIQIKPRSAAGWAAFTFWIVMFLAMGAGFAWAMGHHPGRPQAVAWCIGFLMLTALWAILGILWMKARSEVIDVAELMALKRQLDDQKRRGRR